MQVAYHHPPRRLNFYIRYVLILLIICLPIVLVLPIWYFDTPIIWLISLILIAIAFRISSLAKPFLELNVSHEDHAVPKTMDISSLEMDVSDVLEDTKLLLELEGFARLGEIDNYHASADQPVPSWVFSKGNGKILVEAIAIKSKAIIEFTTYGEEGLVSTTYPFGHRVTLDHAHFSAVSSSIEDAYKYHLQQVQTMRPKIGRLVPVQSVKQAIKLGLQFSPMSKVRNWQAIRDQIVANICLSVAFALGFGFIANWWFPEQFESLFVGWRLPATIITFIGSLLIGILVENRKNGIKDIKRG